MLVHLFKTNVHIEYSCFITVFKVFRFNRVFTK